MPDVPEGEQGVFGGQMPSGEGQGVLGRLVAIGIGELDMVGPLQCRL